MAADNFDYVPISVVFIGCAFDFLTSLLALYFSRRRSTPPSPTTSALSAIATPAAQPPARAAIAMDASPGAAAAAGHGAADASTAADSSTCGVLFHIIRLIQLLLYCRMVLSVVLSCVRSYRYWSSSASLSLAEVMEHEIKEETQSFVYPKCLYLLFEIPDRQEVVDIFRSGEDSYQVAHDSAILDRVYAGIRSVRAGVLPIIRVLVLSGRSLLGKHWSFVVFVLIFGCGTFPVLCVRCLVFFVGCATLYPYAYLFIPFSLILRKELLFVFLRQYSSVLLVCFIPGFQLYGWGFPQANYVDALRFTADIRPSVEAWWKAADLMSLRTLV